MSTNDHQRRLERLERSLKVGPDVREALIGKGLLHAEKERDDLAYLLPLMNKKKEAANEKAAEPSEDKPILYYLPIAARGEVTRMIAKIGGLTIEDQFSDGSNIDKASFGSPGSLPCFQHGELKLTQSHAIVSYVLGITPKFKMQTPEQRAKDLQFNAIMDDVMSEMAPVIFAEGRNEDKKDDMAKPIDKWFPVIEAILPENGFVNGLDYPTAADFACVVLAKGQMPFVEGYTIAGVDPLTKYPKFKSHIDRVLGNPEVEKYLEESQSFAANPFGS